VRSVSLQNDIANDWPGSIMQVFSCFHGWILESTAVCFNVYLICDYNQCINQYFSLYISHELNYFSRLMRFYFVIEVTSVITEMFLLCIL